MKDAAVSAPDRRARKEKKVVQGASAPCLVIKRYFPGFSPAVIFDVGANIGRSAAAFASAFPRAAIYSFEPVKSVYRTLEANTGSLTGVRTFNTALGRRVGRAQITSRPASPSNRIVESPKLFERLATECVAMTSGDEFCAEHGIERIGLLKIDAEGHDLDVLIGFQRMLAARQIDLLETEVGANRDNTLHVPFEAVKAYLEPLGYHLLHVHDLAMDTPFSGRIVLRRMNAMFVSDAFVEAHRAEPDHK